MAVFEIDGRKVELQFVDPAKLPEPTSYGVGNWSCRCGLTKLAGVAGPRGTSVRETCPTCHDTGDILCLTADEVGR